MLCEKRTSFNLKITSDEDSLGLKDCLESVGNRGPHITEPTSLHLQVSGALSC